MTFLWRISFIDEVTRCLPFSSFLVCLCLAGLPLWVVCKEKPLGCRPGCIEVAIVKLKDYIRTLTALMYPWLISFIVRINVYVFYLQGKNTLHSSIHHMLVLRLNISHTHRGSVEFTVDTL